MKAMLTMMIFAGGERLGVNGGSDLGEIRIDILRALIDAEVGAGVGIHFGLEGGIGGGEFVDSVEGGDEFLNLSMVRVYLRASARSGLSGRLSGCGVEGGGEREDGEADGQNAERFHGRMGPRGCGFESCRRN